MSNLTYIQPSTHRKRMFWELATKLRDTIHRKKTAKRPLFSSVYEAMKAVAGWELSMTDKLDKLLNYRANNSDNDKYNKPKLS